MGADEDFSQDIVFENIALGRFVATQLIADEYSFYVDMEGDSIILDFDVEDKVFRRIKKLVTELRIVYFKQQYKLGQNSCPFCGQDTTPATKENTVIDPGEMSITLSMQCPECFSVWDNLYVLTDPYGIGL